MGSRKAGSDNPGKADLLTKTYQPKFPLGQGYMLLLRYALE